MSRHHQTPEWKRARRERLDMDGWRCQGCRRAGRLEVHHLHSMRDGGNHALENLVSLCRQCHMNAHRQPQTASARQWARLIEDLK